MNFQNYIVRELELGDFHRGLLKLLAQLTIAPDVNQENMNKDYKIYVVHDFIRDLILAVGTLFIEHKFIRNLSRVGHIQDVVVLQSERGKGLGKAIVSRLIEESSRAKCYKVILDCSEHNVGFYEKLQMQKKGVCMVIYHQ